MKLIANKVGKSILTVLVLALLISYLPWHDATTFAQDQTRSVEKGRVISVFVTRRSVGRSTPGSRIAERTQPDLGFQINSHPGLPNEPRLRG
jgi:hypothetical protein